MQIFTDSIHRIAYATDASAYREMPMGVAYPQNEDDIRELLSQARQRHTHLIPRAGGTSIAGQVVGAGIVVDVSRYMNRILQINADEHWVRVQPGVVRDELNLALRPHGLFFSPETSTSNRCCIGGMVGNNSCGTHSLIYGSTRHHVIGLRAVLADGTIVHAYPDHTDYDPNSQLAADILHVLDTWQNDTELCQRIRSAFPEPSIRRRSCGYALDECLMSGKHPNLCALLTGSEGTLAFITEITLSLDPLPPENKRIVCELLDDINDAWEANLRALEQKPVAVELIDGKILQLALSNPTARRDMEVLHLDVNHLPAAILVSEFWGNHPQLTDHTPPEATPKRYTLISAQDISRVWNLRKAGLGVLTGTDDDAKPIGVIEDTAVAPQRMAAYMHDFEQMLAQLNLDCVFYGHISTGELHLRPVLDIKQPRDRQLFRQVAQQTALLVKRHHGSLSGEHGDGRLRGEFIPLMYGDEVYQLFCTLKQTFDPSGVFNMGKIVNTPPMDSYLRYEIGQATSDLLRRIERCNGAGDCRKSMVMGGVMCPAYKVTRDELLTTRARANVLREKLTRDPHGVTSSEVDEVLSSCLACKGCRSECPSNVDMTRLRSEILQLRRDALPLWKRLAPHEWRSFMVSRMATVERIGAYVPRLYNFFATNHLTANLIKRLVRFSIHCSIPTLSQHSMRYLIRQSPITHHQSLPAPRKRVYLFCDEFTSYQEAELGLRFAQLLRVLGYEVVLPRHVESGRAAISKGHLRYAARLAQRNTRLLAPLINEQTPLVGIEPSCILSFRDEYPKLVNNYPSSLASNALLYDEFLCREIDSGNITIPPSISEACTEINRASCIVHRTPKLIPNDIWLHGHCHQKALIGVEKTARLLQYVTTGKVHVIPASCCGMAGSFGYEQEHYDTSMAIGEQVLFPTIRSLMTKTTVQSPIPNPQSPIPNPQSPISSPFMGLGGTPLVCAPGTSCREQIRRGTGITAYHPIDVLYGALVAPRN
ncbi:MAG: FAD-binding protein [Paludibacteraceae bacterium]|nr:FAD-binding protein [Paludibacteraceae bacterium]